MKFEIGDKFFSSVRLSMEFIRNQQKSPKLIGTKKSKGIKKIKMTSKGNQRVSTPRLGRGVKKTEIF
jgi:hypothetical protein